MARRPIMDVLRDVPPIPPDEPKTETMEELFAEEVRKYAGPKHSATADMGRVQSVLSDGVTAAHHEACSRVDKVVGEARSLMDRLVVAAEAHKARLRQEGQDIAVKLEAAIQELTKTVEWAEHRGTALKSPELIMPMALPKPVASSEEG